MGMTAHSYDLLHSKGIRKKLGLGNISDPSSSFGRRKAREVPSLPNYGSLGRLEKTRHQTNESGFASAVGAQQPHQFPGTNRQLGNSQLESRRGLRKSEKNLLDLEQIGLSKKFCGSEASSGPNRKKVKFFFRRSILTGSIFFQEKNSVFPRFCSVFFELTPRQFP